jgi:hypothetical protein
VLVVCLCPCLCLGVCEQRAVHCLSVCVFVLPNTMPDLPVLLTAHLQALKEQGIAFMVAPYEADAQMAYLAISGDVHAVITEDSDLLVYGCPRVRRMSCVHAALCPGHGGSKLETVCADLIHPPVGPNLRCCTSSTGTATARRSCWMTSS